MVLFGSLTFSHVSSFLIVLKRLDVHVYIPTLFYSKHLKTKINIYKECLEKGVYEVGPL